MMLIKFWEIINIQKKARSSLRIELPILFQQQVLCENDFTHLHKYKYLCYHSHTHLRSS